MKYYPVVVYVSKSKALMVIKHFTKFVKSEVANSKGLFYVLIILLGFVLGLSPVVLNYVVDPYNMNKVFDLNIKKEKLSLKSHYPLWKMINHPKKTADTLILGDSRALALKDKYWHQLELSNAYNFAYGGATIDEIYDTFQHVKSNKAIKNIVLGIQLRSLSPHYKNGMNRVPEAISLAENPLQYYSNGFITQMSWKHVKKQYPEQLSLLAQRIKAIPLTLISSAHAAEFKDEEDKPLKSLLDPKYCAECTLPIITESAPLPNKAMASAKSKSAAKAKSKATASAKSKSAAAKNSPLAAPSNQAAVIANIWQHLWPQISLDRQLPPSFEKQVRKNAKSDWETFNFSNGYWKKLIEIALWCDTNEVKLIFFIPPTIAEMQQQITNYGYSEANHKLRVDLSQIAPVIDFDFNNPVTQNLDNFNDAYHFNYKLAKSIIGELIQILDSDKTASKQAHKRRENIACPISDKEINQQTSDQRTTVLEGDGCRIWRKNHG